MRVKFVRQTALLFRTFRRIAEQRAADREQMIREAVDRAAALIRDEYTVMPRFGFHQPLDYCKETFPPKFEASVIVAGEELPLPPTVDRMGIRLTTRNT